MCFISPWRVLGSGPVGSRDDGHSPESTIRGRPNLGEGRGHRTHLEDLVGSATTWFSPTVTCSPGYTASGSMDDEPDLGKSLNFLIFWNFQIPCGSGCGQVLPGTQWMLVPELAMITQGPHFFLMSLAVRLATSWSSSPRRDVLTSQPGHNPTHGLSYFLSCLPDGRRGPSPQGTSWRRQLCLSGPEWLRNKLLMWAPKLRVCLRISLLT